MIRRWIMETKCTSMEEVKKKFRDIDFNES
jgi:hypothetical protein